MNNDKIESTDESVEVTDYMLDYLLYILRDYSHNQKFKSAVFINQYITTKYRNKEVNDDIITKMIANTEFFKDMREWAEYMAIKKVQLKLSILDNFDKDDSISIVNLDPRFIYSRVISAIEEDKTKEEMNDILLHRTDNLKNNKEEKNE